MGSLYTRFWNPDWIIRSDRKNLKRFIFAILLVSKTALWGKNRDLCEPQSNPMVLRTVIKLLLTVPYYPLNLNLKKKKNRKGEKEEDNDKVGVAPWSNCFFFFFLFFLLLLCLSPYLIFLLNFVMYMVWFLTFSFFVFVMTTLTLAASIGNIESFLSSPRVYSTLTLAA